MPTLVTSLTRAFKLLDAPDRPKHFARATLTKHGRLSEADLAAAAGVVGFELPEEYRGLLALHGPFELEPRDRDDCERASFLGPTAAVAEREPLHEFLQRLLRWVPEHPHKELIERPASDLLPALLTHDLNGHASWVFYARGSEDLFLAHEKDGLEPYDDTLEESLIQQVCNFARWDLQRSAWWPEDVG